MQPRARPSPMSWCLALASTSKPSTTQLSPAAPNVYVSPPQPITSARWWTTLWSLLPRCGAKLACLCLSRRTPRHARIASAICPCPSCTALSPFAGGPTAPIRACRLRWREAGGREISMEQEYTVVLCQQTGSQVQFEAFSFTCYELCYWLMFNIRLYFCCFYCFFVKKIKFAD